MFTPSITSYVLAVMTCLRNNDTKHSRQGEGGGCIYGRRAQLSSYTIAKEMLNVNRSSKFNCGNVKYWWTLLRNNSKIGARAWWWF